MLWLMIPRMDYLPQRSGEMRRQLEDAAAAFVSRYALGKDAAILGMSLYNATDRELVSMHAAFEAGLANGTLRPVVSSELPLAEAATAHHAVMEASTFGKIVLTP